MAQEHLWISVSIPKFSVVNKQTKNRLNPNSNSALISAINYTKGALHRKNMFQTIQ